MEPLVIELDDFQKMALQKAIDDKTMAERAYNAHDATLRRLVALLMKGQGLKQEEWPFVEFDRLAMGIVRFQPAQRKEPPPEKKDEPPAPPAEGPSDPPPTPPGPHLLPAADGKIPEMEWDPKEASDTPEALPPT